MSFIAVLSIVLAGTFFASSVRPQCLVQPHHFWVGAALLYAPWWPLALVGHVLLWDDAILHAGRQAAGPSFRSPLLVLLDYPRPY